MVSKIKPFFNDKLKKETSNWSFFTRKDKVEPNHVHSSSLEATIDGDIYLTFIYKC